MAVTKRQRKVFHATVDTKKPPYEFALDFKMLGTENRLALGEDGEPEVGEDGEPTGRRIEEAEKIVHEFEALGEVGAGGVMAMASMVRYDEAGNQHIDINAFARFFKRCMAPAEYERFYNLVIEDQSIAVSIEMLGEVFQWLTQEYTGRPTQPSSS